MSNPTLAQVIAAITPLFADAVAQASPPVVVSPPLPAVAPAPTSAPAALAGLRQFATNIPWETPGQINRTISGVIDPSSVWLAHFTPIANSVRPGRIQIVDAFSQDTFRTYLLYRDADGAVLAKEEGITATFTYWVGPGTPDPTATWCAQFQAGVPYTVAVFNRAGVTESGQAGLDLYQ